MAFKSFRDNKAKVRKAIEGIKKEIPWIIDIRKEGEEEDDVASINKITYYNVDGSIGEAYITIIHEDFKKKFFRLRGKTRNSTVPQFKLEMSNVWVYLGAGRYPERPFSYALTKVGNLPNTAFTLLKEKEHHKKGLNDRFSINIRQVDWQDEDQACIDGSDRSQDFERIREK